MPPVLNGEEVVQGRSTTGNDGSTTSNGNLENDIEVLLLKEGEGGYKDFAMSIEEDIGRVLNMEKSSFDNNEVRDKSHPLDPFGKTHSLT